MNARACVISVVIFASAAALFAGCNRRGSILPPVETRAIRSLTADPYATAVLNDSPTAYYRLDDTGSTAADSSPNALNAAIGSSVTTGAAGLLASSSDAAVALPGTASAAGTVKGSQTTLLQPAGAVTMEVWLSFASTPATYTVPLAYGDDTVFAPYDLYFVSGKIAAQFYLNTGVLVVTSPSALSANKIYYIAATYDGTTGRLYINGAQVASGTKTGTFTGYKTGFGLAIGDDAGYSDPGFKGTEDEVAIYAGKALTATQISNHYTAGTSTSTAPPTPTPTPTAAATPTPAPAPGSYSAVVSGDNPTAYYHLDDSGSTAQDASGNGFSAAVGSGVTRSASGLVPSTADTAMSFPGVKSASGMVTGTAAAALQPANAVSMELWLRFASSPALYTVALAYGDDTIYAPYDLYFVNGKIAAQFYLNTGVLVVTSPNALSANTTYYVAATYDGATARLYLNGSQVASNSKTGTFTGYKAGFGLGIGDDTGHSDPAFNGTIDEVAIYAGKALTATQISNHYTAGTSTATPTPSPTAVPTLTDWSTFGYDLQRTGYNPNETGISSSNAAGLHSYWPQQANIGNGQVGEPVIATNVNVGGQSMNLLYAGSASGIFKAFNADTGALVWSAQLGTITYSCGTGGGSSSFGVEGTAVIDRATNRVYVPDGKAQVHALDLATGAEASGWPVTIATPASNNFIYAGLTYNPANHILYAETSSTCDISPWYGRIEAIDTTTASAINTFYPTQGTSGGGIWSFGGASIDPSTNNVFVATGNADNTNQAAYYAEQVIELSADLSTVIAHNYPNLPASGDADFGATPLLFQPPGCPALVAAVNKSGVLVLYDRDSIGSGPVQTVQMSASLDQGDFIGVPAYDPVTHLVYVGLPTTFGIYRPGMAAFSISSSCTIDPTPAWSAAFGPDGTLTTNDSPRSPITIANGVVFIGGYTDHTIHAFDASSGAALWTGSVSDTAIPGPVVANGHLYAGSYGGYIFAWTP